MRRPSTALVLFVLAAPRLAGADPVELFSREEVEDALQVYPPNMSTDLLDPSGRMRTHLTSRVTFSDADQVFSPGSVWSFELFTAIRLTRGLALTAVLPFGFHAPSPGEDRLFFGNLRLGVEGGGFFRFATDDVARSAPKLGFGGALDIYAPTTPSARSSGDLERTGAVQASTAALRGIRAYQPELYLADTMAFRARGHLQLAVGPFTGEVELGLSPAFTLESRSRFMMLLGWAARASFKGYHHLEPYAEIASSLHLGGAEDRSRPLHDDLSTPVLLTLGARAHLGGFDPALFVALNLDQGGIIFGLDLAGAVRDYARAQADLQGLWKGR